MFFEDKKIYVFDKNISSAPPAWSRTFLTPKKFIVTEETPRKIGALHTSDNNSRLEIVAEKGGVGVVHYGPYVQVMPGLYDVALDLSVGGVSESAVWFFGVYPYRKLHEIDGSHIVFCRG